MFLLRVGHACSFLRTYAARAHSSSASVDVGPGRPAAVWNKALNILFLTNAHNSMSQRAMLELEAKQHRVHVEVVRSGEAMEAAKVRVKPDLIIAPILTSKVPESIWRDEQVPCLIVHPGVQGDRGMSSIDWALKRQEPRWGVTVLQAAKEMDSGAIWSSKTFSLRGAREAAGMEPATKSSLYKVEVIDTAMRCIHEAVDKLLLGIAPTPLDYTDVATIGQLNPTMSNNEREITDWAEVDAASAAHIVRFSDSQPGAPVLLHGKRFFAFGAVEQGGRGGGDSLKHDDLYVDELKSSPGTVLGKHNNAVLVQCSGNSRLWLRTLREVRRGSIKLPAAQAFEAACDIQLPELGGSNNGDDGADVPESSRPLLRPEGEWLLSDIWTHTTANGVRFLHFDFPNGASATSDCHRLAKALRAARLDKRVKTVCLMGGQDAFSNGLNLNVIEASEDPAAESNDNIRAINDCVREVFLMKDKATVAVLQGGAGAGGVMLAAACDEVWAHEGVVLNPHYRLMGLHGSEYFTFFLPRRIGEAKTKELTTALRPISARQAHDCGLVDVLLGPDVASLRRNVVAHSKAFSASEYHSSLIQSKTQERDNAWVSAVEDAGRRELAIMAENFRSPEYQRCRANFVHKVKGPGFNPAHLVAPGVQLPIDGQKVAAALLEPAVKKLKKQQRQQHHHLHLQQCPSRLAMVIGDPTAAALSYMRAVSTACRKSGVVMDEVRVLASTPEAQQHEMELVVSQAAADPSVHGIVLSMPLPAGVDLGAVAAHIPPIKDVDGITDAALARLARNDEKTSSGFVPCTAQAVLHCLLASGVQILGSHTCVVGRGRTVGLPLANLLANCGATVVSCNVGTDATSLERYVRGSDIVVGAAGCPGIVNPAWIKPGATVINVGMSYSAENGRFLADIDLVGVDHAAKVFSSTMNTIGPVTAAILANNTILAQNRQLLLKKKDGNVLDVPWQDEGLLNGTKPNGSKNEYAISLENLHFSE